MNYPVNVLHIIANLASGGVQHLLTKSLASFDRTRFNHMVCCISAGGIYEVELRKLNIPYWIMKRRCRFDPSVIWQMVQLMRRRKIQVVHTMNFTANLWGRIAAIIAGIPRIIAHERGTGWTENNIMRLVDRLLYPFTDVLLANSEASKIILCKLIGLSEERIKIVYNGLPDVICDNQHCLSLRSMLGVPSNAFLVGAIGRLDTPKGLKFLLDAIPYVWQEFPETHFVIIGDGPLGPYFQEYAHNRGLLSENRLHFTGFLPQASQLMKEMDVIVHPSIHESLGNTLIEAGFARKPVVGCYVDGCGEVIANYKTGILIEGTEPVTFYPAIGVSPLPKLVVDGLTRCLRPPLGPAPDALANALIDLLLNPKMRVTMGNASRERVLQMFSIERYVQEIESVYREDE